MEKVNKKKRKTQKKVAIDGLKRLLIFKILKKWNKDAKNAITNPNNQSHLIVVMYSA